MITSLRKRIVTINVVSAAIILFAAVIITFALGIGRINAERNSRLEAALNYDETTADVPFEQDQLFGDICLVTYNLDDDEILSWHVGRDCDWSEGGLYYEIKEIAHSSQTSGMILLHIHYFKTVENGIAKIAFYNFQTRNNNIFFYFGFVILGLVVALAAFLALSMALARMTLEPVEQGWKSQKQFVADASHELKTPLSVIMANTEMLSMHQDETVGSQMRWVENTQAEAKRMAVLVADLLTLAKSDDGLQVAMEEMDLSQCVNSTVLGMEVLFYENDKQFSYNVEEGVVIEGNEGYVKQLINILLDNANKYSVGSGNIKLNLTSNSKYAQLTVSNDCVQLTPEQLSHLFDRFYTVDQSRNKNSGGNGLGLAIVQMICHTHGGDVTAVCENGNITFTATLAKKHRPKRLRK